MQLLVHPPAEGAGRLSHAVLATPASDRVPLRSFGTISSLLAVPVGHRQRDTDGLSAPVTGRRWRWRTLETPLSPVSVKVWQNGRSLRKTVL